MLLSSHLGKQCAASQIRFYLPEFKDELMDNDYEITIDTEKQGTQKRLLISY